jgi:hypothetical protein
LASVPGLIAAWGFHEGNANNTINIVKGILNGTRIGEALAYISSAPVGNSSVYFYAERSSGLNQAFADDDVNLIYGTIGFRITNGRLDGNSVSNYIQALASINLN